MKTLLILLLAAALAAAAKSQNSKFKLEIVTKDFRKSPL
jgi:hypothetical protein